MKPSEVAAEAVIWGLIEAEAKHRKLAERMGPELLAVKAVTPTGRDVGSAAHCALQPKQLEGACFDMSAKRRLGLNEAAEYLGVNPRTIRRYIASGRITAYRLGPRLIKVDRDELDALLRPVGGGGKASFVEGRTEFRVTDVEAFTRFVAEHYPTEIVTSVGAAFQRRILTELTAVDGVIVDGNGVPVDGVELRQVTA